MSRRAYLGELPADHRQRQLRGESVGGSARGGAFDGRGAEASARAPMPFLLYPKRTVAGSMQALPGNEQRRYLAIQNRSAAVITVNFGADAASDSLEIGTGAAVEWFERVPSNAIHVWAAAAGGAFVVIEG